VGLLLAVALAAFFHRGVSRAISGSWDFTMVYAAARQVAVGGDPYAFDATYDGFVEAGGIGRPRDPLWFNSLYPPTTYTLLAPLGLLDWKPASWVWLGLNVLATAAVAGWLLRHRPLAQPRTRAWLAVGLWLGVAPLHTAVAFGQLSVIVLALMLPLLGPFDAEPPASRRRWRRPGTLGAGLMLGVAGLLKPQLVLPLALILLATPRRAAVGWAAALAGVVAAAAWWRLNQTAPAWLEHWAEQINWFAGQGFADPTAANAKSFQMIHLEPWLHRAWPGGTGPAEALRVLGAGLPLAVLLAGWAWLLLGRPRLGRPRRPVKSPSPAAGPVRDPALLWLALAAVLTLMMAYHRTYDAVLLVVPALWVWRRAAAAASPRWVLWTAGVCLALLALPGPVLLDALAQRGGLAAEPLTNSWPWRALLLGHHHLALLALTAALLAAWWSDTRATPTPTPRPAAS
jgi:hypothetical protein